MGRTVRKRSLLKNKHKNMCSPINRTDDDNNEAGGGKGGRLAAGGGQGGGRAGEGRSGGGRARRKRVDGQEEAFKIYIITH